MPDFASIKDRDAWIVENADSFQVRGFHGVGEGWDRMEFDNIVDARKVAQYAANKYRKLYGIYAVAGIHDALIESMLPQVKMPTREDWGKYLNEH
jgi:hypothetical protein